MAQASRLSAPRNLSSWFESSPDSLSPADRALPLMSSLLALIYSSKSPSQASSSCCRRRPNSGRNRYKLPCHPHWLQSGESPSSGREGSVHRWLPFGGEGTLRELATPNPATARRIWITAKVPTLAMIILWFSKIRSVIKSLNRVVLTRIFHLAAEATSTQVRPFHD